jgi:thiol:disulfide interchange protein
MAFAVLLCVYDVLTKLGWEILKQISIVRSLGELALIGNLVVFLLLILQKTFGTVAGGVCGVFLLTAFAYMFVTYGQSQKNDFAQMIFSLITAFLIAGFIMAVFAIMMFYNMRNDD